jgi:hypothetical protein
MKKGPACPSERVLSRLQLDAVKLIASGCTARYAALVLKIKFSEVKKWTTQDQQFKVAVVEQARRPQSSEGPETAKISRTKKALPVAHTTKT